MRERPDNAVAEQLSDICRRHSLPLTVQRRVVLDELSRRSDHPTADEVYGGVRKKMPEISRTTVYRVLEAFVGIGVVRRVCHPGSSSRYETRMHRHHHLICLQCEAIVDLESPALDKLPLPKVSSGFTIEDYSVQFRGICRDCARNSVRRSRQHASDKSAE